MIMALLLDLTNIVGGFVLALGLLRQLPRIGREIGRLVALAERFGWIIGIVALVAAGYFLIYHAVSGPHLLHFEVVGTGVGVVLLWNRLIGREPGGREAHGQETRRDIHAHSGQGSDSASGVALLLAIFGLIAIVVGIQGLFTPNG